MYSVSEIWWRESFNEGGWVGDLGDPDERMCVCPVWSVVGGWTQEQRQEMELLWVLFTGNLVSEEEGKVTGKTS